MVLPVATPPLAQILTDPNTGEVLLFIKVIRMNDCCSSICMLIEATLYPALS